MHRLFLRRLQTAMLLFREALQSIMFSAMSNRFWFEIFNDSPISLANKGLLSFTTLMLALFQLYFFYYSPNKNIDGWLTISSALTGSILSSIAMYGAILSSILSFTFAAGLWFFMAGLLVGLLTQLILLGINFYRSFEAEPGSAQRKHYQQAALYNGFKMIQIALSIIALVFTLIIPVTPIVAAISCFAVVGLIAAHIAWRFGPSHAKQEIKQMISLGKPSGKKEKDQNNSTHYRRFFTARDYISEINVLSSDKDKQETLHLAITKKLDTLKAIPTRSKKTQSKINLLKSLLNPLNGEGELPSKLPSHKNYPGAFQSFWREKSDVEQLYDAVMKFRVE